MSSTMLDPSWTPDAGYAHALGLLAIITKGETMQKKKTKPAPSAVSIKIPRRAYTIAQRIAKREQRTITTVVERALVTYAEGSSK